MSAYSAFASVYDSFMSHIPYDEWGKLIDEYLKKNNVQGKLLELGCGTGKFSFIMEKKGYNVIGVDNSPEMIQCAKKIAKVGKSNCDFVLQDMRVLEQQEEFGAIISVCDSMNYLTDEFDLESVFEGVAKYLSPNGLFLFDLKTESFYKSLGEQVFTDENENGHYIWKNFYDEENKDNYYELTFFIHKRKELYEKRTEEHLQHVFTRDEIWQAADKAGLVVKETLDMNFDNPGDENAQRIYYVLERKQ